MTAGEVVGSVDEKVLLDALFAGRATLADRVEKHMSAPLPIIGSGEPVSAAVAALGEADALLVHVDGKPAGVVTRQDVLGHRGVTRASGFNTRAIHAGQEPDLATGAVIPRCTSPPPTSRTASAAARRLRVQPQRQPDPTALHEALAALEEGTRALAFASGLAAEDTLLRTACRPGDHVVLGDVRRHVPADLPRPVGVGPGTPPSTSTTPTRCGRRSGRPPGWSARDPEQPAAEHHRHRAHRGRRARGRGAARRRQHLRPRPTCSDR